jgi:hypothetical protein
MTDTPCAQAENEEEHIHVQTRSGLTIRIPPRIVLCALCHTDYLLPLAGDQSDRCRLVDLARNLKNVHVGRKIR